MFGGVDEPFHATTPPWNSTSWCCGTCCLIFWKSHICNRLYYRCRGQETEWRGRGCECCADEILNFEAGDLKFSLKELKLKYNRVYSVHNSCPTTIQNPKSAQISTEKTWLRSPPPFSLEKMKTTASQKVPSKKGCQKLHQRPSLPNWIALNFPNLPFKVKQPDKK